MNDTRRTHVLANFTLTSQQREAALARGCDVAVTAGAGSGKTSNLVARYACLLADGLPMRSIVAITFTEKAALEMRARVRQTLVKLVESAVDDSERQFWAELNAGMDSARISTIHSLCTEILRSNPVEARVDPRFGVIDEGLAAALKVNILEDTLAALVEDAAYVPLFGTLGSRGVKTLLEFLLNHRLEAQEAFEQEIDPTQVIAKVIESALQDPAVAKPVSALREYSHAALVADAGDVLTNQVEDLLREWDFAEIALARREVVECAQHLFQARRNHLKLSAVGGKHNVVKELIRELQYAYDEHLDPICGGANAKDEPPRTELEEAYAEIAQLIPSAFNLLVNAYKEALAQQQTLDFDDLEYGAAQLLKLPEIQERWRAETTALLVDEFQDTNERQRKIVEALAGGRGILFVVGDAKQSIYRFRRADVTVFRTVQSQIKARAGLSIDLDTTFRAHEPLLSGMGDMLQALMGTEENPARLYEVPYAPMLAHRLDPPPYMHAPHIEFILGAGTDADSARPMAARALAQRLLELKAEGQISSWDDVTLLFRATSGYIFYETAFEDAAIPFVTVAGRGFYDRPEIRDLLNMLRALADPTDDLAMAGLMRSPAFGLSDAALYQLRWQGATPSHYWDALGKGLSGLSDDDQPLASRLVTILTELIPLVDRIPVAELLKRLVDATDYRSILAIGEESGTGGRLWRNLDKLLVDAQGSGILNVRDFLDYLTTLNDAGAREGEAPAEALGAVRLMTIHKSKGLQFKVVVLADASRQARAMSDPAYLLPGMGLAFKLDPTPMIYRAAKQEDQRQSKAEERRLLYVALTRAQDKLLISGHVTTSKEDVKNPKGWMEDLCGAVGLDVNGLVTEAGKVVCQTLPGGQEVRAWAMPEQSEPVSGSMYPSVQHPQEPEALPIYSPLPVPEEDDRDRGKEARLARVTGTDITAPAWVVGKMVHKAIECWCFPNKPRLLGLLEVVANECGLTQVEAYHRAQKRAVELLKRLQAYPLWAEVDAALERFHEVPYARMLGSRAETGYIDLLYRTVDGWQVLDFKTDAIQNDAELEDLVIKYTGQMRRYREVVTSMLGQPARTRLVFLDVLGQVRVVEVG